MNKKKIVLSVVMLLSLCVSACAAKPSEKDSSKDDESSITELTSIDSSKEDESSEEEQSSEEEASSEEPIIVTGDNFNVTISADRSMMSSNCKKYVDDMRAQQRKLIKEKGADADYYLNDLYGLDGVDITKGIPDGDNGGYRPANIDNQYLDPVAAEWEKGEKSDENKGIEISFVPSDSLKNKEYTISYGQKADLSDAKTMTTSNTTVRLKNLLVNQKYYFKVSADGKDSDTTDFTTGDYPRWIDARPMFNVRDHGGYMTSSGQRIKQGLVFRGGEITPAVGWKANSWSSYTGDVGGRYTGSDGKMVDQHITSQSDASKKVFREDMGMVGGIEIDLRSSGERNGYTKCGFAENGDISYILKEINSYDSPMKDANKRALIKDVFEKIAEADQHPVYYHCYGGADRTGTIGFLLGAMLGMSYTDLVIDFELTSYSSNPSRNYRSHLRSGPYNYWPRMITYLQGTLGWGLTKTIKQSAEEFLVNDCKISQTTIDTIRNIMLEPAD